MKLARISIQARLTTLVLGTVLLFGLIAGYASYNSALHEADEIFDAQLAQYAQNLMVISMHVGSDVKQAAPMPPHIHNYQQTLAFQVRETCSGEPRVLLRSDNIAEMSVAQMPAEGYSNGEWHDKHWRFYRLRNESECLDILVGQIDHARNEMAQEIAFNNLSPFLLGLPLLALFAILAIRVGFQPLNRLTESLQQLSPEQLEPIAMHNVPKEIAPVVDALNNLLDRTAAVMENERRFTADASHELRTPLAALQAQVQAAQLADDETERRECLDKALQGTQRMAHLVEQLLTLSRLDEFSSMPGFDSIRLADLVEECCAELGADAIAKHIEIGFSPAASPTVAGSADMLRILLRNLLDNAIRYTPPDGRVEVSLRLDDARQAELEIADSGIGVAAEQLAVLGQRFNRISPNVADGVGLGLSIVERIADLHHAQLSFNRAATLGGLSVTVRFPLPPQD